MPREPVGLKIPASFVMYKLADGRYCADSATEGVPDVNPPNADAAVILQAIFDLWASLPAISPSVVGGTNAYPGLAIRFNPAQYYFSKKVTINMPGGSDGASVKMFGVGEDITNLILASGVNDDMFSVTNMGSKIELYNLKFIGQRTLQSGTSNCWNFTSSSLGGEFIVAHCEFRDWLTACWRIASASIEWTTFQEVWMLNAGIGLQFVSTRSDIRIQNCKFDSLTAIEFTSGNLSNMNITGCTFRNATITFPNGGPTNWQIGNNLFYVSPNNTINLPGTGLASLKDCKGLISANSFDTSTGTNVAINLGNFVDGVVIQGNIFTGYTPSATVPITLVQGTQKINTFIGGNRGYNPQGFTTSTPAVPASTVAQKNNNPYPIRILFLTAGTVTVLTITDPSGTSQAITTALSSLDTEITLDPYAQITLTYSAAPTWKWYGI